MPWYLILVCFKNKSGAAQAPMEKGFNRFQLVRSVLVGSNGYFAFARRVFWSFVGRVCRNTDPGPRGVLYTNLRAKRPARPGWYAFFTKSWYAFFAKSWYAPKRKNGYAPDRKKRVRHLGGLVGTVAGGLAQHFGLGGDFRNTYTKKQDNAFFQNSAARLPEF